MVDSPDPQIFEQAIFIVRNDAFGKAGVTPEQIVSEACRVARGYTAAHGGHRRGSWRGLPAGCYSALGAGAIGLVWVVGSFLLYKGPGTG